MDQVMAREIEAELRQMPADHAPALTQVRRRFFPQRPVEPRRDVYVRIHAARTDGVFSLGHGCGRRNCWRGRSGGRRSATTTRSREVMDAGRAARLAGIARRALVGASTSAALNLGGGQRSRHRLRDPRPGPAPRSPNAIETAPPEIDANQLGGHGRASTPRCKLRHAGTARDADRPASARPNSACQTHATSVLRCGCWSAAPPTVSAASAIPSTDEEYDVRLRLARTGPRRRVDRLRRTAGRLGAARYRRHRTPRHRQPGAASSRRSRRRASTAWTASAQANLRGTAGFGFRHSPTASPPCVRGLATKLDLPERLHRPHVSGECARARAVPSASSCSLSPCC